MEVRWEEPLKSSATMSDAGRTARVAVIKEFQIKDDLRPDGTDLFGCSHSWTFVFMTKHLGTNGYNVIKSRQLCHSLSGI